MTVISIWRGIASLRNKDAMNDCKIVITVKNGMHSAFNEGIWSKRNNEVIKILLQNNVPSSRSTFRGMTLHIQIFPKIISAALNATA